MKNLILCVMLVCSSIGLISETPIVMVAQPAATSCAAQLQRNLDAINAAEAALIADQNEIIAAAAVEYLNTSTNCTTMACHNEALGVFARIVRSCEASIEAIREAAEDARAEAYRIYADCIRSRQKVTSPPEF